MANSSRQRKRLVSMRRLLLLSLIGWLLLVAPAPARSPSVAASGKTLLRPGATSSLTGLKRVWFWADYWDCRVFTGTVPPWITPTPYLSVTQLDGAYILCGWIASGFRVIPVTDRCGGQALPGTDYRITVCVPTPRLSRARHIALPDVRVAPGH